MTNSCHTEIELYNPGYFVGLAIKNCPNFKFLKVQNIKNLNLRKFSPREIDTNSKLIKHIAKNCEKFEGLDIKEEIGDLSKDALEMLIEKRKNTLRSLKLYAGKNIKDDFLSKIPLCTKLEQFALHNAYEIGPKGLAAIAKLRQLRSLEISQLMEDKGFKPKDLVNLFADKNMEFLEKLSLVGMPVDAIPDEVD